MGSAPKVAQVTSFVFAGTWEATDVINITIGSKTLSVVAGSTTVATVVLNVLTAWNALDTPDPTAYPEFNEITASQNSGTLILTSDTLGKPFSVSITTTETGGGAADAQTIDGGATSTGTNTVTNSGPNVVSLASNWEGGVAPVDGDDVIFDSGNVDVLYDLNQNGVTPASILIDRGYTGKIGLPATNEDVQNTPYHEYRETYLRYGTSGDATNIAVTIRGGGRRIKYSAGSSQATFRVDGTGTREDDGIPCCLLKGTHASNALHVSKGDVGFAFFGGETGTLVTLNESFQTNQDGDSQVMLGAGVTLTAPAIVQSGGTLETNSAITSTSSVVIYGGTFTHQGTGGIAAGLAVRGGTCIYNSNGTLGGNTVISGGGHLDFSRDLRSKTVSNAVNIYGETSKFSDPNKVTGAIVLDLEESVNSDNIILGRNIRLTRGSVA